MRGHQWCDTIYIFWAWIKSSEDLKCNLEQLITFLPLVSVTNFFHSLKFYLEHIFGSKHLSYVLWSDSLIVEISDEICIYFSDAGLRLQRFGTSQEQGKCQPSSVHFSKGEHKELVAWYIWLKNNICSRCLYYCTR